MQGKIVKLPRDRVGFQYESPHLDQPFMTRHVWELCQINTRGSMSYCRLEEAFDKPASSHSNGTVSCYVGNGNYVQGAFLGGTSAQAISVEILPIPMPKVRRGIETVYRNGKWLKYLKTQGWVNA